MSLHAHIARPLRIPARPLRTPRRSPRGERLAWRLVYLLTDMLHRELRGPRR